MFRSKSNLYHVRQAFAGAFLLALIFASVLGTTRVYATGSTTNAVEMASPRASNLCAALMQSSDYALCQEEAVLSAVMQSNWNAAEMASPNRSSTCAAETQSSDTYLRQKEAILSKVIQSNLNIAEMMAFFNGSNSCAAGMQSSDYYLRQEEAVLSKVTQSNWVAPDIASLSFIVPIAQAGH
jgi:hypothetical protein